VESNRFLVGVAGVASRMGPARGMSHTEESMTVTHIEIPEPEIAQLCQRNRIRKLALFGSVRTDRFFRIQRYRRPG